MLCRTWTFEGACLRSIRLVSAKLTVWYDGHIEPNPMGLSDQARPSAEPERGDLLPQFVPSNYTRKQADCLIFTISSSGTTNMRSRTQQKKRRLVTIPELLEQRHLLAADVIISEFMASNDETYFDGNGDDHDWIELYNAGDQQANLLNYSLTDNSGSIAKWKFPAVNLAPGEYLTIFASGQGVPDLVGNLHTNFSLSSEGEYLGLYDAAGVLRNEYGGGGANYPALDANQSYGRAFSSSQTAVVQPSSTSRYFLPTNGTLGTTWTSRTFNDATWAPGTAALGYETTPADYAGLIQTQLPIGSTSVYVRVPFAVSDPSVVSTLTLQMKYDDGFVAYLNGEIAASANAPSPAVWNSVATTGNPDSNAVIYEDFDLSARRSLLVAGTNVLSIHMLNTSSGSSDFLAVSQLLAGQSILIEPAQIGYLQTATPRSGNSNILAGDLSFSRAAGTFIAAFNLTLTPQNPGETMRYTLDGTAPTNLSPPYSAPISIIQTTQVRARAFAADGRAGPVRSATYTRTNFAAPVTSNLPIIILENFGQGEPDRNFQNAAIAVFEPDGTGTTTLTGTPTATARIGMHRRGSSTFGNPKTNYRIEIRDESGNDKNMSLLGLPSESDWILNAPYQFDRSIVRDSFLYSLSNQMGKYASRTRFVEVYSNSSGGSLTSADYMGVYVLMENVKRDENRINIAKLTSQHNAGPQLSGGYMLKIDRAGDPGSSWKTSRGTPTIYDYSYFVNVEPDVSEITPAQQTYIRQYLEDLENALYGPNYRDPQIGYRAYLDPAGFIDHHILRILAKDPDALRLSEYMFKDRNGQLSFGPVWDCDRCMGPDDDGRAADPQGWDAFEAPFFGYDWWGRLFQDSDFTQQWIDRIQQLRPTILNAANFNSTIDGFASLLTQAQSRNFARWPEVAPNGGPYATGGLTGWEGEVSHLKGWLAARINWMVSQFAGLPAINLPGGNVPAGTQVTLSLPAGATGSSRLYYTLDGTDPRMPGGGIASTAILYTGQPIVINSTSRLTVRLRDAAATGFKIWSSPQSEIYNVAIPADVNSLRITELHYHPSDPTANELLLVPGATEDSFEFVELQNTSSQTISLTGVRFTTGVSFDFTSSNQVTLLPGEVVVVVSHLAAFQARYGTGIQVAGQFASGQLADGGERIVVTSAANVAIHDFTYDDAAPWPVEADGTGPSLEVKSVTGNYSQSSNWRLGINQGTPGRISGDFDLDGDLDSLDLDGLVAAIAFGSIGSAFDVTGDLLVNQNDLTRWVDILFGTLRGDANLDRVVDGTDFGIWNSNKFTVTGAWSRGDFNADGISDGSDFGIWNSNKFQSASRPTLSFELLKAERHDYSQTNRKRTRTYLS